MINTTTVEMSEEEHGLIGCGNISFVYTNNGTKYQGYYNFTDKDYTIQLSSKDARRAFEKLVMDESVDINTILRMAADSCGIQLFRIKEPTRKAEVVFARYLVFWFVTKYLKYSLTRAGDIFDKDHVTALYGVRAINEDPKYLKESQQLWRRVFMNKLKEKDLIEK